MQPVYVSPELREQFRKLAGEPVDPVAADAVLCEATAAVEHLAQQMKLASYLDPEVADRQVGAA